MFSASTPGTINPQFIVDQICTFAVGLLRFKKGIEREYIVKRAQVLINLIQLKKKEFPPVYEELLMTMITAFAAGQQEKKGEIENKWKNYSKLLSEAVRSQPSLDDPQLVTL